MKVTRNVPDYIKTDCGNCGAHIRMEYYSPIISTDHRYAGLCKKCGKFDKISQDYLDSLKWIGTVHTIKFYHKNGVEIPFKEVFFW